MRTQNDDNSTPTRPSVIKLTSVIQDHDVREHPQGSASVQENIQERVQMMWAAEDQDQVEAVVGPYTLYDSSFRTLHGNEWLSDEVIDAYLHLLTGKQQKHVHHLSAVVATALFSGQLQKLGKMKFPVENLWLCPVNVGAHWILVFILPPALEDYARPSDQIAEQTAYQNGAASLNWMVRLTATVGLLNRWQGSTAHGNL
ncbi:uncharacterized protein LOC125310096 isoform X2 [Alosa alosa]|nr:uncharacterized protein LOC125310096 isoform X2 [Alosa alosa]